MVLPFSHCRTSPWTSAPWTPLWESSEPLLHILRIQLTYLRLPIFYRTFNSNILLSIITSSGTNSINQQRVLYTLAIHLYSKPLQTSTVCLTFLTLYKQTRYMAIKLTKISCIMIIIHYHREIIQREIKYDNFISRCKVKF